MNVYSKRKENLYRKYILYDLYIEINCRLRKSRDTHPLIKLILPRKAGAIISHPFVNLIQFYSIFQQLMICSLLEQVHRSNNIIMNEITRIIYFVFIQGKGTFIHLYIIQKKIKFSRFNKTNFKFIYRFVCNYLQKLKCLYNFFI